MISSELLTTRVEILEGDLQPPELEEFQEATESLKNNKGTCADDLPAEFIKCGGRELTKES